MKIGRGNTVLMLAMNQLEYNDIVRQLRPQEGQRPRVVMTVLDNDQVSLRFNLTEGFALYQASARTTIWQAQSDLKGSGAVRLNTFGQTDVTLRTTGVPGEVIATLPPTRKLLQTRNRRDKTPPSTKTVSTRTRTSKTVVASGQVRTRHLDDGELIRLKTALNEALEQGYRPSFDDSGRIQYFERRIG
jgi:hypothetical protein